MRGQDGRRHDQKLLQSNWVHGKNPQSARQRLLGVRRQSGKGQATHQRPKTSANRKPDGALGAAGIKCKGDKKKNRQADRAKREKFKPQAACVLRAACCVLRAACCVLRAACCVLRAACCVLRAACCVLRAAC
ncbi:hypothetical protein, partial [Allofranklinella schreckenbergeri]|uniref:hypothetical protein n=1 Tax=Allofranklinella schreckenbergeri TaxID=1076744 RepID=UPI001EEEE385